MEQVRSNASMQSAEAHVFVHAPNGSAAALSDRVLPFDVFNIRLAANRPRSCPRVADVGLVLVRKAVLDANKDVSKYGPL